MPLDGVPAYLMADTVDEDYRFETLPHTTGKDRRDMVERKLKQLYRSTPILRLQPAGSGGQQAAR